MVLAVLQLLLELGQLPVALLIVHCVQDLKDPLSEVNRGVGSVLGREARGGRGWRPSSKRFSVPTIGFQPRIIIEVVVFGSVRVGLGGFFGGCGRVSSFKTGLMPNG